MTSEPTDLYRILGVPPRASQAEVRRAYLSLVRQNHPDIRPSGDPVKQAASSAMLHAALAAYTVLGDPERRAGYDQRTTLHQVPAPRPSPANPSPRSPEDRRQPPITVGPVRWHRSW